MDRLATASASHPMSARQAPDPCVAVIRAFNRVGLRYVVIGMTVINYELRQLKTVIRERRTLVATSTDGLMVELLLAVSGYSFSEFAKDVVTVTVRGTPIRVGRLTTLLRSKQLASRPKDRQFLTRYRALLEEK
jgi:hypothetical protein